MSEHKLRERVKDLEDQTAKLHIHLTAYEMQELYWHPVRTGPLVLVKDEDVAEWIKKATP